MSYQALPSSLHVKDSPIAGQGIFAKEDIDAMMYIGVSHIILDDMIWSCLLYTSPSPRDKRQSRMPSSA